MKNKCSVTIQTLLILAVATACTQGGNENLQLIRIEIPPRAIPGLGNSSGLTDPTSLNDIICVSLNITGSGIPSALPGLSVEGTNSFCSNPGIFTDPVSLVTGGTVVALVPGGSRRRVQVLGLQSCTAPFSANSPPGGLYVVGENVVDIFSDLTIDMTLSYDTNNPKNLGTCFAGGGGSGGPPPMITSGAAPLTPVPTVGIYQVSVSSGLSITFSAAITQPEADAITLYCSSTYADALAAIGGMPISDLGAATLTNSNQTVEWNTVTGAGDLNTANTATFTNCYLNVNAITGGGPIVDPLAQLQLIP